MILITLLSLLAPTLARAQDASGVDAGIAAYEEGDFAGAEQAFARALESGELTREDFTRITSHRLLIAQAEGDDAAVERLALQLVSLDPNALGDALSPQLQRSIEEAQARADGVIRLELEYEELDEGVEIHARVRGDVGALVQSVSLSARATGGDWLEAEGSSVIIPAASTDDIEVVAHAVGPHSIVLAALGTPETPANLGETVAETALATDERDVGRAQRRRRGLIIGLVVAGVVLAAGGVTLGVLLANQDDDQSRINGPIVEF